jgi:hypothetical protein
MVLKTPTVIHKYDVADFTTYSYWQIFFQDAGTFLINGSVVTGVAGAYLDLQVSPTPTYISGGTGLYLLGDACGCGPFDVPYTGSTSDANQVGTRYYYGNIWPEGQHFSSR